MLLHSSLGDRVRFCLKKIKIKIKTNSAKQGFKIHIQKLVLFLDALLATLDNEIKRGMPFTKASKRINDLGINLTKKSKTCTLKTIK